LMSTHYENLRLGSYGKMDKIDHKHKMKEYTRETISFKSLYSSLSTYPLTCYDTGGEEGPESNQVAR